MNLPTPTEQRALDAAEHFAATLGRPNAAAWDRGRADTHSLFPDAARAGLLGLEVPVEHGGQALSFGCKCRVAEILAAADFGLAMALINSHNVANHLARMAAPAVAREYVPELLAGRRSGCTALTEPDAGSDFAAIATSARRVGDEWQLDGRRCGSSMRRTPT